VEKSHSLLAESINMTYVILPSDPKNIGGSLMSEKKKLALIVHSGTLDKLFDYHAQKYCPPRETCLTEKGLRKMRKKEASGQLLVTHGCQWR
jgi:hypothetical protein